MQGVALGCGGMIAAIFAVAALIIALQARSAAARAQQRADAAADEIDHLRRMVNQLRSATAAGVPAAETHPPQPAPVAPSVTTPPQTAHPTPIVTEPPHPIVREPAPPRPIVNEVAPPHPITVPEDARSAAPPAMVTPPPPPPRTPPTTPPPPTAPPPHPSTTTATPFRFDWESLVGVKLFSWIAGFALVLAAIFFLRYSVDRGWLNPAVRATIGLFTGAVLLAVCELRVARDYKFTANALHGAGIAILYATLFATHALWHLMPVGVVFGLMLAVTAVAVMLSIRRDSVFIALLGLVGGFATPALLSSGENRPIALFSYLLLLNGGLAWVAYRKRWPVLTAMSIALTVMYEWAWLIRFLTPAQFPLAIGIFVVFAVSASTAFIVSRDDGKQTLFERAASGGATLPILFAFYSAAVPAYGARFHLLFGFLLIVNAGLAVIAWVRKHNFLHEIGAISTLIVFAMWLLRGWTPAAWPAVLIWIALFIVLFIAAAIRVNSYAVYAAPLMFFTFVALVELDAPRGTATLLFATVFILLAAVSALAIWRDRGLLYYIAAFFTIAAEAAWSAKYLTPQRLTTALTLYGLFALFFLGVPLLARRFGRTLAPRGAVTALVLVSVAMLLFLASSTMADAALWGLAILLAIINMGALFEARTSSNPLLSGAAILLSWIVLAVWWSSATLTISIVPALIVVGGFAVLIAAGSAWTSGQSQRDEFASGSYLALIGHVFLLFVVTQPALSQPPWPLFAILGLLDLALGVAALYLKRERLLTAALVASQLVLLVWSSQASALPWPNVALAASLLVAAMGAVWFGFDRRFAESAAAGLIGAYVVATAAGAASSTPLFGTLLAAHVLITLTILAVAWFSERGALAVVAAVMTAFASELSRAGTPGRFFAFGATLYALLIAYPLLLGGRVKKRFEPHLAAVFASGWFFFVAREAMHRASLDAVIGALPIGEAFVMTIVLWRLLAIERRDERLLSRLALVAGTALAFITVAVPLQLEKQWITIGWALEGAALAWLFTRIPHRGLLFWAGGLLGAVFVRLTLNPAVLTYHPPGNAVVFNWYLYTYVVAAAAMFIAAWYLRGSVETLPGLLNAGATILLFLALNIEIADFYSHGRALTFNFFSSSLAQDLTYTIGWACFAVVMLITGIIVASRASRIAAIALFLVTILKCFLHDLARLGGLYRVASLLGLAASLVVAGVLLQKFVMLKPKEEVS